MVVRKKLMVGKRFHRLKIIWKELLLSLSVAMRIFVLLNQNTIILCIICKLLAPHAP